MECTDLASPAHSQQVISEDYTNLPATSTAAAEASNSSVASAEEAGCSTFASYVDYGSNLRMANGYKFANTNAGAGHQYSAAYPSSGSNGSSQVW